MPPFRTKHVCKRVMVFYDDVPSEGDAYHDIMVMQSAAGRIFHSTGPVTEPKAGTSNCTGPWDHD